MYALHFSTSTITEQSTNKQTHLQHGQLLRDNSKKFIVPVTLVQKLHRVLHHTSNTKLIKQEI